MGGNSTTWMNTGVLVTCLRNFQRNRGSVSGILKGYVALSTAIFSDLCSALFSNDPCSFLALLSLVPFAVCLSAILFLREIPFSVENEREDSGYFWVLNGVAVVVAIVLMEFDSVPNPSSSLSRVFSVALLILLASPVAIRLHWFVKSRRGGEGAVAEALLGDERGGEGEAKGKMKPVMGEDHKIGEAMKRVEFWVLFGAGSDENNMGQIGLALGYDDVSSFIMAYEIQKVFEFLTFF